jgi:hypothetical protein
MTDAEAEAAVAEVSSAFDPEMGPADASSGAEARRRGAEIVRALVSEVVDAGEDGLPLLALLRRHEAEGGLGRAVAVSRALCALQDRSVLVGVCVADERRYVSWKSLGFWPAAPLSMGTEETGHAAEAAGQVAEEADTRLLRTEAEAAKAAAEKDRTSGSGLKLRAGDASTFFVPGPARDFGGGDSSRTSRLRASLISRVVLNPGIEERTLLAPYSWALPTCLARAVLHAVTAAGELFISPTPAAPPPTLFGHDSGEEHAEAEPAQLRHYFLSPSSAASLAIGDLVSASGTADEPMDWDAQDAPPLFADDEALLPPARSAEAQEESDDGGSVAAERNAMEGHVSWGDHSWSAGAAPDGRRPFSRAGPRTIPPSRRHEYVLCRCNAECTRPGPFTVFAVMKPPLGSKETSILAKHQAGLYHGMGEVLPNCGCGWDQVGKCCPHAGGEQAGAT